MQLHGKYETEINAFVEVCHRLSANMYVTGHGGNLARKLKEDLFLITPTRMNKGDVQGDDVVIIDSEGTVVEGRRRPTGETPMYVNFFHERPDVNSVIHCHPPVTNAFAISTDDNLLMRPFFPETVTEVGPVPLVPYAQPLTQDLADRFLPFLQKYNAFLMENHGLVILSPMDLKWVMMCTELLEMSSLSLVHARSFGSVKEIPPHELDNLDMVMRTRQLPMFGAPGVNSSLREAYSALRS